MSEIIPTQQPAMLADLQALRDENAALAVRVEKLEALENAKGTRAEYDKMMKRMKALENYNLGLP